MRMFFLGEVAAIQRKGDTGSYIACVKDFRGDIKPGTCVVIQHLKCGITK